MVIAGSKRTDLTETEGAGTTPYSSADSEFSYDTPGDAGKLRELIDRAVALWFDPQGASEHVPGRLSVAHDQLPPLEDQGGWPPKLLQSVYIL